MSSIAVSWAWSQVKLSISEKLILIALAEHADEMNSCYPSVRRLVDMTGASERTVRTAIGSLANKGAVHIEHRHRDNGTQASSRYVLQVQTAILAPRPELPDADHELLEEEQPAESAPLEVTTNNSTTSRNNSSYSVRSIARRKAASIEDELDPEKAVWGNEGGADAPEPRPKAGRKNLRTRAISAGGNLARDFAARARKARPGMPGETNQGALSGQFNRWMKQDDLDASVIRGMFDTYFSDDRLWDSNRPMWVDFLNKRSRLVTSGQREADLREAQDNRLNPDYWTEVEQVEHDAAYWESV